MDIRTHQRGDTLSELLTSLCEISEADTELPANCDGRRTTMVIYLVEAMTNWYLDMQPSSQ